MSIGSELTAARVRADMTIEQLSAATRIRTGLLVAMEADDFSRCGGTFYARGHIRSIARVVKADPAPLLATFDAEHAVEEEKSRREERAVVKRPSLHPARPRWAVVVGAILVGLMGWGMVRLFTLPSDIEANASKTASTTPAVTTPVAPKPTPTATSKATPKPPPRPPAPTHVKLVLTAKGDGSYVTLRNSKGKRLFQGMVGPGVTQTITNKGIVRVSIGAPANLVMSLNGDRLRTTLYRFTVKPDGTIVKSS
ncbi:helix-turn-helix domain-containing protein [Kribbella capetownensis]|uniref:Helix-turn-helix domain-containing protein n=1 Tax=Kribbella capetownensis TaxID=1572659 RepID=A0A4R0K4U9_9ACTN|nr:helix-turn-helix domain-containing protein [Kribbella capetownensis]TCC49995.1 helix-turn-helix domain-containing protein [Kribbella capetownensis]